MGVDGYPDCIRELYEGEVFGEAIFLALYAAAKTERDRYSFGTVLQFETETKARLRPLMVKHQLALDESQDFSEEIEGAIAFYEALSPEEFAAANIPLVEGYLKRFEEIAALGDDEDREMLESMVSHEKAFLTWVTMEARGEPDGALDEIIAQLVSPLPVPASLR